MIADFEGTEKDPNQDDAFERELAEALRSDAPENQLRANLGRIAAQFDVPDGPENPPGNARSGRAGWWSWVVGGLVLSIAAVLFFKNSGAEAPPVPTQNQPAIEQPKPTEPAPEQPKPTKTQKHKNTESRPAPIAAAFRPLPPLEKEIGSQVRGGDLRVKIAAPAHAATLPRKGAQVEFRLAGEVENWRAGTRLEALVFSNDRTAWEAFRPLHRHRISADAAGRFVWEENLPLGAGVFYLLIENSDSGEWTFVDKFFVQ